jgi:hypothetical protein
LVKERLAQTKSGNWAILYFIYILN